jgi:hypothetical protein
MIEKVETLNDAKETLRNLVLISGHARKVTRLVEGIKVDFENGSFNETGFRGLNIGGYRRRKRADWGVAYLEAFYIHNDSGLVDSTLETKAKFLNENKDITNFVILPKELEKQAKILGATPVSSMRAERQAVEKKQPLPEGKVNLRIFKGWGDRTEFDHVDTTATCGTTYVLIENAETSEVMQKYLPLQKLINKIDGDVKFAFPSKATMKALNGKPDFITEAEFLKDAKKYIGNDAFNRGVKFLKSIHVGNAVDNYKAIYNLKNSAKHIVDENFVNHFKVIKGIEPIIPKMNDDESISLYIALNDLVKAVFDQALGPVAEIPSFIEYVKKNYPSVRCFEYYSSYEDDTEGENNELVHYVNGKYSFMNRKAA